MANPLATSKDKTKRNQKIDDKPRSIPNINNIVIIINIFIKPLFFRV